MHTTHSSFPSAYGNGLPLLYKVSSDSYIVNALSLRRLIYRLLLFFPVSSTFYSLSVCLSFYHLKTKHKTKSVHDSALFSSDFPIILLSSQTKLLSTTILQTTCPSIIQSTSAPATLLKFVLTKHPWLLYSWIQWTFSLNIIESFRPLYIFQWNSSILCLLWHCTHVSSLLPAYLAISSPFLCCVPSL